MYHSIFFSFVFFFSSRRRHTRWPRDWSSDVCSSDLSIFGPIHVLLASNTNQYYNQTIMAFLGLLVLSVLGASLVSGKNVFNLPIQRKVMIFVVLAFLVFLTIAYLVRRLVWWWSRYDEYLFKNGKL